MRVTTVESKFNFSPKYGTDGRCMIAEIYHKLTSCQEDELTGNFFGTMRYLPFHRGLNQIFMNYAVSEDPKVKQILKGLSDEDFDIEFWKRSEDGQVEIDGFIPLTDTGIGIEVKYQSGLSGEEQLEKEAKVILNEWCKCKEKMLLLVANSEEARKIYIKNKDKPIFREVHLAYLSWQDVLLGLNQVVTVSSFEKRIIEDLKLLLIEKGFVSFEGFNLNSPIVKEEICYDFG